MNDENLVSHIIDQLSTYQVAPDRIIFEVTETAAVADIFVATKIMKNIRAIGCQFALDDFGIGFSSFYYLKQLPVDYIKIDGAFIRNLATSLDDQLFVKAIATVISGLGKKTVAEFVEDQKTLELLGQYGVDFAQGNHIGKPEPKPVKRSMELGPRDRPSQAFVAELAKGRTVETPHGHIVHLDIRHLGANVIDSKIPFVRELCLKYENLDPVKELIPIRPVVHYQMGGVHTDLDGATPLPGLYAAGEVACVSINGANRLGSNSLTELLVFGARAGKAAAGFAQSHPNFSRGVLTPAAEEERRLTKILLARDSGGERISSVREGLQQSMEDGAGIYRNAEGLQLTATRIQELKAKFSKVELDDHSRTFNTELTAYLELENLLDVAESIIHSALKREESRGAHQRTDFPHRDDDRYLAHSLAYKSHDLPKIEYQPVTITRWPPGERVYGR